MALTQEQQDKKTFVEYFLPLTVRALFQEVDWLRFIVTEHAEVVEIDVTHVNKEKETYKANVTGDSIVTLAFDVLRRLEKEYC